MAIRKNAADLNANERRQLNEALGRMKRKRTDDWSSFSNIANYHGMPYMCNYVK